MRLAFLPLLLLASCCGPGIGTQPLTPLEGQKVTRVTVHAHPQNKPESKVTLTKPVDVAFVVEHLKDLESRCYDHSSPELWLGLETSTGKHLNLRVSSLEIGPAAPASAMIRHWFPKDDALYQFLMAKAYPGTSR
jgi:hypothetical protein